MHSFYHLLMKEKTLRERTEMLRDAALNELEVSLSELEVMSDNSQWFCWHIMKCNNERCSARELRTTPCWEIARELDDYRTALNVCSDCLVYLSQHKNSILSAEEIDEILRQKGVCILQNRCRNSE